MYQYKYPHPSITADCVVLAFEESSLYVLLIERGREPYKGCWAFPGGFMNIDETVEECARRELEEETGLTLNHLEQLHTFSEVNRDPRERVLTVAFYTLTRRMKVKGSDDARSAQWWKIDELPPLAFDHPTILRYALLRLREKILAEPYSLEKLPDTFTTTEKQDLKKILHEIDHPLS